MAGDGFMNSTWMPTGDRICSVCGEYLSGSHYCTPIVASTTWNTGGWNDKRIADALERIADALEKIAKRKKKGVK